MPLVRMWPPHHECKKTFSTVSTLSGLRSVVRGLQNLLIPLCPFDDVSVLALMRAQAFLGSTLSAGILGSRYAGGTTSGFEEVSLVGFTEPRVLSSL
jgi:hypothetical protein